MTQSTNLAEPWLRGTLTEVPAVQRAVLHALQAAEEDLVKWCGDLTDEEMQQRPAGLASVAFHLQHIPGSVDRLLTYAEGRELSEETTAGSEAGRRWRDFAGGRPCKRFRQAMKASAERVRRFDPCATGGAEICRQEADADDSRWFAGACGRAHAASRRAGDHYGEVSAGESEAT